MTQDADEIAHNAVEDAMARCSHPRALLTALVRWALIFLARLSDDATAADVAFARWSHHRERAAKAPRFAGSRR